MLTLGSTSCIRTSSTLHSSRFSPRVCVRLASLIRCSICSSFVDVPTTSSSQVQSNHPSAPNVRVLMSYAHRFLFVSLDSEKVCFQILYHLRNRRMAYFFTDSPQQTLKYHSRRHLLSTFSTSRSKRSHHMCCRQFLF